MNRLVPVLFLIGFLMASTIPAAALPAPQLRVEAPEELSGVARQVARLAGGDFSAALVLTGRSEFGAPIRVVLATEDSSLAKRVPGWVSGFAVAASSTVVLFPQRVRSYPDRDLQVLLHHEVAHVMVARATGGRPVPRWLNEGIATVAAREWGMEDRARYALAVVGGGPTCTADLDAGFGDGATVARSYALSAAFVRFLQRQHGENVTARILARVATGSGFEAAFTEATGSRLSRAEKAFFEDQAFWNTWVPFLTSSVALWMGITSLALWAIKRRRDRSRKMREQWRLEEEMAELGVNRGMVTTSETPGRTDRIEWIN